MRQSSVRVLIVDDSVTMQHILAERLAADPDIEVVGLAGDAASARKAIKELNPDVMTLDVEMPEMDGLEFLEKVMRLRPMPVVMVSTLTARGSETAITAMTLGAVDCVVKPTPDLPDTFRDLPRKVKQAAAVRCVYRAPAPVQEKPASSYQPSERVVAIGSSTGGVEALIRVLSSYPANCPATVITQHMPAHFTGTFAKRLDRICAAHVTEAENGASLRSGHVYLAPGGEYHLELAGRGTLTCQLRRGDPVNGHRPSVDVLFSAVARCAGRDSLGVILTGMGNDGARGLLAIRQAGGRTIGQDQASSVVYGMPRAAFELGAVGKQLSLEKIGPEILSATQR